MENYYTLTDKQLRKLIETNEKKAQKHERIHGTMFDCHERKCVKEARWEFARRGIK